VKRVPPEIFPSGGVCERGKEEGENSPPHSVFIGEKKLGGREVEKGKKGDSVTKPLAGKDHKKPKESP